MKLTVVVPAHNEQDNIVDTINKIESSLGFEHELIIVNDHSTDATASFVRGLTGKYPNLSLIDNRLEAGFANAIRTGFNSFKTDVVVPVMGDLCDDLGTIRQMLAKIEEGYDVVCGSRYIKGGLRLGGSRLKGILSSFAGWSLYYLLGVPTHDIANAFKMYRKQVLDTVKLEAKSFEISMEIPLRAYYAGFRITEVPTVWRERSKGKSNFRMFKLIPSYLRLYFWALRKRVFK